MEEQIGKTGIYSWEEGQLLSEPPPKLLTTFMQAYISQERQGAVSAPSYPSLEV